MGRQQLSAQQVSRPKRKVTNAHVFRYLQTRNPSKLEENDLKRALEASLEECPDFWTDTADTASCSSSEQSNSTTSANSLNSSSSASNSRLNNRSHSKSTSKRRIKGSSSSSSRSSSMQHNHLNNPYHQYHQQTHHANSLTANSNCCPMSGVHNRYKPVAKKNIYSEADFFHDGIMEYIEYALAETKRQCIE